MFKSICTLSLFCFSLAIVSGCGGSGNQVVEPPDEQKLEAKRQEFAKFQEKMARQSNLPGQR
ncbi:hypothetical protein [Roseiconus lacunae]|uniref:Lipoprotein n=1 Tax=Roseiconus lacunae TaxID=2605694 RepID=A0ABT7PS71_9BACT|nr:hypothetical protein [Roseiconus lacunae]MDM4019193.1 hypothetical protein [Roseiconus lacunae]